MRTIYKYTLGLQARQVIRLPRHFNEISTFQEQHGKIAFWIEVDKEENETLEMADEVFYIVGTGHAIPEEANYYNGTVQIGAYVWHIYQKIF